MRAYIFILLLASVALAQIPKPEGYVNDFAEIITNNSTLEAKIYDLKQSTGVEMAVVTVDALPADETMQTYANKIFNEWGVGKKGDDNGLLILISAQERRVQVETGYGLEGILPDGKIGRILDNHIEELSSAQYDTGLEGLVDDFSEIIRNEYVPSGQTKQSVDGIFPYVLFTMIIFLLIIALAYNRLGNRCPKCKGKLKKEIVSKTRTSKKIKIYCLQCGYHKYVTVAAAAGMMGIGGGRSSGGGGGFGGGSSGGGGAGRGF